MPTQARIIITGIVQGVGFRPFIFNLAREFKLVGQIRNSGNLGVICDLQSSNSNYHFEDFIKAIRNESPSIAYIEGITLGQIPHQQSESINFSDLQIVTSADDRGNNVVLPPDIGICDSCLQDFYNPVLSRYYHYPFIACAQCGPRFTTMRSLPYDRERSTMAEFPFCHGKDSCSNEYQSFTNRRFHAETFGCKKCGPFYFTIRPDDMDIETKLKHPESSEISEVARVISHGGIAAVKGIGGIFLVCLARNKETVQLLRDRKSDRKNKPFAVMVRTIDEGKKYCEISSTIEKCLISYRRPIVLCPKREGNLPENLAPGLAHIGLILPYTGVHYLLLDALNNEPLVYTSGNLSSLPMSIDNAEIITQLKGIADIFYLHNRVIYQRCDDSLLRVVQEVPTLIRRSRGFVPEYIKLPFDSQFKSIIALGPELNSTGAISYNNRIFPTQHIGNVRNLETYEFLESTIKHMQTLLKVPDEEIQKIAHDLHPAFQSTKLANHINKELQSRGNLSIMLVPIQHHHAHLASLMVDQQIPFDQNIIGITIDGVGYGEDGHTWGGEIIYGGYQKAQRLGHLQPIPMIGGDLCAKFPDRMLLCSLFSAKKNSEVNSLVQDLNKQYNFASSLPQKQVEYDYLLKQCSLPINEIATKYPLSSSFGRCLDAAAALFNVCHIRTYQGEPAMRLEGFAYSGIAEKYFDLESYLKGNTIHNEQLLYDYATIIQAKFKSGLTEQTRRNLAKSFLVDMASLFAMQSVNLAQKMDCSKIGLTGGIAVNEIIVETIAKYVQTHDFDFVQHNSVPCGDAGISTGQIAIASSRKE